MEWLLWTFLWSWINIIQIIAFLSLTSEDMTHWFRQTAKECITGVPHISEKKNKCVYVCALLCAQPRLR